MNPSENILENVELNQNKLCAKGFPKRRTSGMTKCINFKLQENVKRDEQLTKNGNISTLLQLLLLLLLLQVLQQLLLLLLPPLRY